MLPYTDAPSTPLCSWCAQTHHPPQPDAVCCFQPPGPIGVLPGQLVEPRSLERDHRSTLLVHLLPSCWLSGQKCWGFGCAACFQSPASCPSGTCSRAWVHAVVALQEWWSPGKWPLLSVWYSCRPWALNVNSFWFWDSWGVLLTRLKTLFQIPINMSVML